MKKFLIFNFQFSNFEFQIKNSPARRGFTLIELLVVISIIGILIALSAVAFQSSRASARDGKRKADLETIRSALGMYRTDCRVYPESFTFGGSLTGTRSGTSGTCLTADLYLSPVPQDPLPNLTYSYNPLPATGDKTSYTLCAHLENGGTTAVPGCTATCGEVCNYGVTSP